MEQYPGTEKTDGRYVREGKDDQFTPDEAGHARRRHHSRAVDCDVRQ